MACSQQILITFYEKGGGGGGGGGGASSAFQVGVPTELIQKQGDWARDVYLRYITVSEPDRLKVAQALSQLSME